MGVGTFLIQTIKARGIEIVVGRILNWVASMVGRIIQFED